MSDDKRHLDDWLADLAAIRSPIDRLDLDLPQPPAVDTEMPRADDDASQSAGEDGGTDAPVRPVPEDDTLELPPVPERPDAPDDFPELTRETPETPEADVPAREEPQDRGADLPGDRSDADSVEAYEPFPLPSADERPAPEFPEFADDEPDELPPVGVPVPPDPDRTPVGVPVPQDPAGAAPAGVPVPRDPGAASFPELNPPEPAAVPPVGVPVPQAQWPTANDLAGTWEDVELPRREAAPAAPPRPSRDQSPVEFPELRQPDQPGGDAPAMSAPRGSQVHDAQAVSIQGGEAAGVAQVPVSGGVGGSGGAGGQAGATITLNATLTIDSEGQWAEELKRSVIEAVSQIQERTLRQTQSDIEAELYLIDRTRGAY